MKKWIIRLSVLLSIGIITGVLLNWPLIQQIATFGPLVIPRIGQAPSNETEARLQDIDYLASLLKYDRSFDEAAREQFSLLLIEGREEAETMSLASLYLLAAKASALANNGHTGVDLLTAQRDFNSVGARYFNFNDGLYVVRALAEHGELIGARVLEIDGQPIESVLDVLTSHFGGTDGWRQLQAVMLLESPEILHAARIADSPNSYTLTVTDQLDSTNQVKLNANKPIITEAVPLRWPFNNLEAEPLPDESDRWISTLQNDQEESLPLYLRQTEQAFLWMSLQNKGGYLRLRRMRGRKQESLARFFEENIKLLPDGSLNYLVVDLRSNTGGDFTVFVEIAKEIPDKVADGGHLYIVVGPNTFSSGVIGTALLKYYGGEKAVIIGLPMGDREQFWAETGMPFKLPNAGFEVYYATGYHDWANGCAEHPYCFTHVLNSGVEAGSLNPVQVIEPNYSEYAEGRDPVMKWIYQSEAP